MTENNKINYLEFPSTDISQTKAFFTSVFGWSFEDFGAEYTSFSNAGIDGGFFKSDQQSLTSNGSALVIFYNSNLVETQTKIEKAGGIIVKEIFSFPGGKRFHFTEPSGNEFAVWSDESAGRA